MRRFTNNLGRGIRAIKRKPRQRPAKVRDIEHDIEEDQLTLAQSFVSRPGSRATTDSVGSQESGPEITEPPASTPQVGDVLVGDVLDADEGSWPVLPTIGSQIAAGGPTEHTSATEAIEAVQYGSQEEYEQAVREQTYIHFFEEEEGDYVPGPARLVLASDGISQGVALLMKYDLSAKIQRAIHAQRDLVKAEREALSTQEVNFIFQMKIKSQISSCESRLAATQDENESPDAAEVEIMEQELHVLQVMQQDAKNQEKAIDTGLRIKADALRELNASIAAYFEEAFIRARLVDPDVPEPDSELPDIDLQKEYQQTWQDLYGGVTDDGEMVPARPPPELQDPMQDLYMAMSPEHQMTTRLCKAYWETHGDVRYAQEMFDRRVSNRQLERMTRQAAVANGEQPFDATEAEFDQRWFLRNIQLTRELIDAEQAFETAKFNARAAQCNVGDDDATSGFLDDVGDGYRISHEDDMIAAVPLDKINKWFSDMQGVSKAPVSEHPETPELLEWECEPVGNSDSASMLFTHKERRRVDNAHSFKAGPKLRARSIATCSEGDSRRRVKRSRVTDVMPPADKDPVCVGEQTRIARFYDFGNGPLLLLGAPTSELS